MSRTPFTLSLAAAVLVAFSSAALAHAHLQLAFPAENAVTAAPSYVDLTFSETLNLAFSGITLVGPGGREIKLGDGMLMDGDKMLMIPVAEPLGSGGYTVSWHVLSSDGHKTNGSYSFTVKP